MNLLTFSVAAFCLAAVVSGTADPISGQSTSVSLTTGRYWYNSELQSWRKAYKTCKDRSSHLVVIDSQEEADNLKILMTDNIVTDIHVGIHDKYEAGKFVTVLDQDVNMIGFNKWKAGYPNTTLGNCGGFRTQGTNPGLINTDCSKDLTSICEERRWDGYSLIAGHGYYKYFGGTRTWPFARQYCIDEGAHLFIVNSQAELDAVNARYGISWLWVGLTDIHNMGDHVTLFNEPLESLGWTDWYIGQPTLNVNVPYVSLYRTYGFYSEHKDALLPFICEHGLA